MKKLFLIAMLSLLGVTQLSAQDTDYAPFVREGVKWICFYYNEGSSPVSYDVYFQQPGRNYFTLELKGDAEYNGKQYTAMHLYSGKEINPEADTVLMYLREQDKIVYALVPNGKTYPGYKIGLCGNSAITTAVNAGVEFILFDFNDPGTYYEQMCQYRITHYNKQFEYLGSDDILIADSRSKRHTFKIDGYYELYIIEGIGIDGYNPCCPFHYMDLMFGSIYPAYYLSHVEENGEIIYKGINYEYMAPWDGRLPLAREGMKWVNEKVIINQGDTTRYYYTYEIKGEIPHRDLMCKQCHYYTGPCIDEKNDSVICLLQDLYYWYGVNDVENHAMEKVVKENRNLLKHDPIDYGYTNDYDFGELYFIHHDDLLQGYPNSTVSEYLWRQKGRSNTWLLNTDNFYRIEDIEIDGYRCNRLVYVDEQGEPLAYLMEGIGFDSRDMGDLLTPFTRQPDPDAEYQEYCGLSHVINRDGKIIYKGMRYDADRVEAMYNDINGDGKVDVADVTALIRKVLNSESMTIPGFNATPDVSDVTKLIKYVLTH